LKELHSNPLDYQCTFKYAELEIISSVKKHSHKDGYFIIVLFAHNGTDLQSVDAIKRNPKPNLDAAKLIEFK